MCHSLVQGSLCFKSNLLHTSGCTLQKNLPSGGQDNQSPCICTEANDTSSCMYSLRGVGIIWTSLDNCNVAQHMPPALLPSCLEMIAATTTEALRAIIRSTVLATASPTTLTLALIARTLRLWGWWRRWRGWWRWRWRWRCWATALGWGLALHDGSGDPDVLDAEGGSIQATTALTVAGRDPANPLR